MLKTHSNVSDKQKSNYRALFSELIKQLAIIICKSNHLKLERFSGFAVLVDLAYLGYNGGLMILLKTVLILGHS